MITHDQLKRASEIAPGLDLDTLTHIMLIAQEGMTPVLVEDLGTPVGPGNYPTEHDADSHGMVEWKRSGLWVRGLVWSDDPPVDATHWRKTKRKHQETVHT